MTKNTKNPAPPEPDKAERERKREEKRRARRWRFTKMKFEMDWWMARHIPPLWISVLFGVLSILLSLLSMCIFAMRMR